jgi:hypothetical protein
MAVVIVICTLVLLALIVLVVSAPLRDAAERRAFGGHDAGDAAPGRNGSGEGDAGEEAERDQLEAAREAKYREIRDAELDFRTGKLSERDYRELDAELRAEALAILDQLEGGVTPTDASAARSRSRRTGPRRRPSSG